MGIIIDIVLAAIIALGGWRGWRAGIIRGVCGTLLLIASIYLASVVASAYSSEFTGMLKPFAGGVVDALVSEALGGGNDGTGVDADDVPEAELPQFDPQIDGARELAAYIFERVGLSSPAAERVSEAVAEESEDITFGLSARITDKLCSILAYIAVFLVCFTLLSIIFAVIGNVVNLAFSLPGLELLDSIAGVLFGVAKTLLIIFTLAIALRYFGILTAETVENTGLLRYIVNVNPIANILGI